MSVMRTARLLTCGKETMVSYSPRRPPVTLVCPVCSESFSVAAPKADRGRRYCSKSCVDRDKIGATAWNKGHSNKLDRACPGCGVSFLTSPSKPSTYCSRRCYWDNGGREWSRQNLLTVRSRPEVREALSTHLAETNPLATPQVRARAQETLRSRGWAHLTGGNGTPLPEPQQRLLQQLSPAWVPEFVIRTKGCPYPSLPNHYKVDLALPDKLLAVEADGQSHLSKQRKLLDEKKDRVLTYFGWTVLRFNNRVILSDTTECARIIQETASRL